MNDKDIRIQLHHAMDARLSGMTGDPRLAQRIISAEGSGSMKRKISVGLVLALVLLLAAVTALGVLFKGHEVVLYQEVELSDLLPEQTQQYNICHRISSGYLIGGFELGEDYLAPMSEGTSIVCLDDQFQVLWTLTDDRLTGSLFDILRETPDALYFGTERRMEEWEPAIMKVSKSGEILWYFHGSPSLRINDFLATDGGDVYCVGSRRISGAEETFHPVVLKLGSSGEVLWEKEYQTGSMKAFSSLYLWNNHVLVVGQEEKGARVLSLSMEGEILSAFTHETDEEIIALRLQKASDEKLLLVLCVDVPNEEKEITSKIKYILIDPARII